MAIPISGINRQILGSERFTSWLVGMGGDEGARAMFYHTHHLGVQKVQMNFIAVIKV